jgi:hypothetical protein
MAGTLGPALAPGERRALLVGVFATTLATLLLEQLDARLLSVITWYHLAFFAVSLAMLGMAAGAIAVFLAGDRLHGAAARRALSRFGAGFAVSIALGHAVNAFVPIYSLRELAFVEFASLGLATISMAVPFFLSGVVVTIALTRVTSEIGLLYGVDLLGAALGCLLVIPLLGGTDLSSSILVAAALAALGAFAFSRLDRETSSLPLGALAAVCAAGAIGNAALGAPLSVQWSKGDRIDRANLAYEGWNDHSYVILKRARRVGPFFWGKGQTGELPEVDSSLLLIDGSAGTPMTGWDGNPDSIDWVQHDVTALPHHLRAGDAAVIGVGGGRDVLAALWGGSRHVLGIEVNGQLLELLRGPFREHAGLADHPRVELVHAEARSYLTHEQRRFDLIQMSLIDTWASTGAGAYSLSENGLYTLEAWQVFLERLKPSGLLSVSRWFAPSALSETSRLLSLAVGALLERGVADPARHLVLVTRGPVATLLASNEPLGPADLETIDRVARANAFQIEAAPGRPPDDAILSGIVASRSRSELVRATEHSALDYSPPTDERPYFFNLLKLSSFRQAMALRAFQATEFAGGVLIGNARATATLLALLGVAMVLTLALIGLPLWRRGLPAMRGGEFALACGYFALIGMGYMLVQIPALQRFSIYLGHPTYALAVVLFTMILFSGLGSFASDRQLALRPGIALIPALAAALIGLLAFVAQPLIESTISARLPVRCVVVVAAVAPISFLLGFCFPLGLRAVAQRSPDATAWMWGVNGAFGVVASILAVLISMAFGISAAWLLAAGLYAALAAIAGRVASAGDA